MTSPSEMVARSDSSSHGNDVDSPSSPGLLPPPCLPLDTSTNPSPKARSDAQFSGEMYFMSPTTSPSVPLQQTRRTRTPSSGREEDAPTRSSPSSYPVNSYATGTTDLSSWQSEAFVRTPGSSWDVEAVDIVRGAGGRPISQEDDDDEHSGPSSSPELEIGRKGKGRASPEASASSAVVQEETGRKDQPSLTEAILLPPSPPSPPFLISYNPPTSSSSALVQSSELLLANDSQPLTLPVPFRVFRSQTQPFIPRPPSTSSSLPLSTVSFPGGTHTCSTDSSLRFTSRSRANSLLSFSPLRSASSSASGSSMGRKIDEIKEKLKLTKVGGAFRRKGSLYQHPGKPSDSTAGESSTGGGRARRLSLFGQKRPRPESLVLSSGLDALNLNIINESVVGRAPSTVIPLSNPTIHLVETRPPSPFPLSSRPPSRTHLVGPKPMVTRAFTTTSLTPPAPPTPTPFLVPRSASGSPRTLAVPFSPSSSNNPSLLSLTRPPSPASPKRMDHFDRMLPREIKLLVFRTLLNIWRGSEQVGLKKSERWTGEVGGRRELIRLSRVSKSWLSLVFDGELWATLSVRSYANLPPCLESISSSPSSLFFPTPSTPSPISIPINTLLTIAAHAGPFLRSLDLRNLTTLSSSSMHSLTLTASTALLGSIRRSFDFGADSQPGLLGMGLHEKDGVTRLTKLDLSGCRSFSAHALHHLLAKSPFLRKINLRALPVVSNATFPVLFNSCPLLLSLDLSRCPNIDSTGVALLTGKAPSQRALPFLPRPIKELRLAGLKDVDDDFIFALARGTPSLQILDLSGCKSLTNEHVLALVAVDAADRLLDIPTVELTSKEMGRDPSSSTIYHKRVTSLRHLNLSSCPRLTDEALTHLAFAVPRLEFLETAGLGSRIRDKGLVRLFATTERIRRVDLEGASEITDAVLGALTPEEVGGVGTGSKLEHLVLSYAARITADGMMRLVRGCEKLKVLEVDNTKVSDAVVKEFVRLVASRRMRGAEITVTDSRNLSKSALTTLHQSHTRPRRGFRGFASLPFAYQDAEVTPEGSWAPGRSELDSSRVVISSFWGWTLVDSVRAEVVNEKKRRAALAAASVGVDGPSTSLTTMIGGRRLLGWRSSSGSGVVLLEGMPAGAGGASSPTSGATPAVGGTPPLQVLTSAEPVTPFSMREGDAGCVVM